MGGTQTQDDGENVKPSANRRYLLTQCSLADKAKALAASKNITLEAATGGTWDRQAFTSTILGETHTFGPDSDYWAEWLNSKLGGGVCTDPVADAKYAAALGSATASTPGWDAIAGRIAQRLHALDRRRHVATVQRGQRHGPAADCDHCRSLPVAHFKRGQEVLRLGERIFGLPDRLQQVGHGGSGVRVHASTAAYSSAIAAMWLCSCRQIVWYCRSV